MIRLIILIIIVSLLWELYKALKRRRQGGGVPPSRTSDDPYEILGTSQTASPEEIKAAYREKIKEYHPDKFQGQPEWVKTQAEEMTQKINRAYEALKR